MSAFDPPEPPRLVDGDLVLRGYRATDLDGLMEYRRDPVTRASVGRDAPVTRRSVERFLLDVAPARDDQLMWAIDVDGEYVGGVELTTWGRGFDYRAAKLGYGVHPAHRGKGVARRAASLALDHAWRSGLQIVVWQAVAGNEASWRVARSLGATSYTEVEALLPLGSGLADAWHAVIRPPAG